MAEKRLFHAKIQNTADESVTEYEAFYEAHTVGSIRKDAGDRYVNSTKYRGQAFTVKHETLTEKPQEFYDRLKKAEATKKVVPARVKGLGQRWEVLDEGLVFFVSAADENGGVNEWYTSRAATDEEMKHFARIEEQYPSSDQYTDRLDAQTEDDRVGIPDDQDDYEGEDILAPLVISRPAMFPRGIDYEHVDPLQSLPVEGEKKLSETPYFEKPRGWDMNLRAKPEFYDLAAIANAEDAIAELTRQDHMHAIAGFDIPEDKKNGDSGKLPSLEEMDLELEKLRKNPSTYDGFDTDEIPVIIEEKRSSGNSGNSGSPACLFI